MGISSCFKNRHRSYIEVLPRFRTGSSGRGLDFPHEADSASMDNDRSSILNIITTETVEPTLSINQQ
jgi:hypothetical protein